MSEGPKLYTNKPRKGVAKEKAAGLSSPSTIPSLSSAPPMGASPPYPSSSSSSSSSSSPPPPPPVKESFARRYKFLWPILLTVNLVIGAYLFTRTSSKKEGEKDDEVAEQTSVASANSSVPDIGKPLQVSPVPNPVETRPPISEYEQRQLLEWILEEKRKVKPKDPSEKKRIDEEKALLKQYIRAKSIPSF